ncbi:multiple epidermal growth factor-like domains protein 6 isoform X3 [Diabrotica virgifera virgifera]|uniref:TIL domain-containing protein n=1 Tax=Diabrotica virgifera virgifera TaxID=50390 RepID=A0ABM5KYZ2_DIAVI|nr:multiple epidermal growth factor-like domains protein 6 isoform X3 [Diabrotica virgifera virgifera]
MYILRINTEKLVETKKERKFRMEKVLFVLMALCLCQGSLGQLCRCPRGEIWNNCASCDPEATCQNRIPEAPGICPAVCQQRCECDSKNGLIRDQISGACVPIDKCPGCSRGEIWNECASCTPEPTCQNRTSQIPKICPDVCYPRCECDANAGFIRDAISGQCIPREQCPGKRCPRGEIWNNCASCDPEATCQNRIPEAPGICPAVCQQRCECDSKNGLIRDQISGACVPIDKCPGCSRGEIWNECASCNPEPTCQNRTSQIPKICPDVCYPRCECDANAGFIRDAISGQCIPREQCPGQCGPLEVLNECASPCAPERTCRNQSPDVPDSCILPCEQRCECDEKRGLIRDEETGKCIDIRKCQAGHCGPLEVFNECASPCVPERTCQRQSPIGPDACILSCEQRCECDEKQGLIRDEESGNCIDIGKCQGRCGPLEVFNECASPCLPERTCQYQFPVAPKVCILSCEQRCECDRNQGLIRDKQSGECIDIGKCEDRCSRNQFWGCRRCCPEATCDNPNPPPCSRPCPKICINECLCNKGYVRNTRTGECVLSRQCPRLVG